MEVVCSRLSSSIPRMCILAQGYSMEECHCSCWESLGSKARTRKWCAMSSLLCYAIVHLPRQHVSFKQEGTLLSLLPCLFLHCCSPGTQDHSWPMETQNTFSSYFISFLLHLYMWTHVCVCMRTCVHTHTCVCVCFDLKLRYELQLILADHHVWPGRG